jgi:hypothetical protein
MVLESNGLAFTPGLGQAIFGGIRSVGYGSN